jgi:hypothetical protein
VGLSRSEHYDVERCQSFIGRSPDFQLHAPVALLHKNADPVAIVQKAGWTSVGQNIMT